MNEGLVKVISGLRELADCLEVTLKNETKKGISKKEEKTTKKEEIKVEPITIEKVRAVLAEKSQSGKQPEVKALIKKYGAKKLTAIDSSCYPELLKDAEEL